MKKELKSVSSLVSSSMQPEEIVDDRDDSSCFHIHLDVCAFFDIQITGKGNCQNRRKGLTNSEFWEEKKGGKEQEGRILNHLTNYVIWGKGTKKKKKKKREIFNSLHMISQLI